MEEEWADGADGFFTEFAENTKSSEKSARKRNREAREDPDGLKAARAARSEVDRKLSVEEARRKIAAAVANRASTKEVEAAKRAARKSARREPHAGKRSAGGSDKSRNTESIAQGEGFAKNKRSKVDEKFARKQERKDEAKAHAIKYRRSIRKR